MKRENHESHYFHFVGMRHDVAHVFHKLGNGGLRNRADDPEFVAVLTDQIDQVLSQNLTESNSDD